MNPKTDLKSILKILAEKLLPRHSGYQKALQVDLVVQSSLREYVRVIFYRPRGYMLASYKSGVDMDDISYDGPFCVTSYHDSTWKYDGLSFLGKISKGHEIEIISFDILPIIDPVIGTNEDYFLFKVQ